MLLLHGFSQSSYEWRAQLAALGSAGYRAVAPDMRGYSPGARPAEVEAYRLEHLVDDAVAIADRLGTAQYVTGPYRFLVIEDVSHWLPEDAADAVNAALLEHLQQWD